MDTTELLCIMLAGAVVALLYVVTQLVDKVSKERERYESLWRGVQGLVDGTWGLRTEATNLELFRKRQTPREVDVPVERRS